MPNKLTGSGTVQWSPLLVSFCFSYTVYLEIIWRPAATRVCAKIQMVPMIGPNWWGGRTHSTWSMVRQRTSLICAYARHSSDMLGDRWFLKCERKSAMVVQRRATVFGRLELAPSILLSVTANFTWRMLKLFQSKKVSASTNNLPLRQTPIFASFTYAVEMVSDIGFQSLWKGHSCLAN